MTFRVLAAVPVDRVGDRDLVAAHGIELAREVNHGLGFHVPFVGAAQTDRDDAAHLEPARNGFGAHFREAREAFGNRAIRIALGKTFGRCTEYNDFVGAGCDRGIEAFAVRNEDGIGHARLAAYSRHHFGVVGHLRHPFGRYERGGFDNR